jgi:uncharacterized protein (TIGR03437 family)
VDASGDVFISDYNNYRVREVTTDGIIRTIAGNGLPGYAGDGGTGVGARISNPAGLAVDGTGHLYIADAGNAVIRLLTPQAPSITAGRIQSASDFGAFQTAAPGSWIEIYGTNLSVDARSWATSDFTGSAAPTSLDGTGVTIGGQPAFVYYISGSQVNAQVPANAAAGSQPVVVKTPYGSSAAGSMNIAATQPGLLATSAFKINGLQYAVALFSDAKTYVLPTGAISGITSRPAKAGDIITLYGVGFGSVTNNIPTAGQVAPANNSLTTPIQFYFGQTPATLTYYGLEPGYVGLYQFNLIVPALPPGTNILTFTLGGVTGSQTLYLATQ